jgi:Rrf2 family protein
VIYNRYWQYGMRILIALGAVAPGERVSAATVARKTGVPAAFASKILSRLAAAGLVTGRRGPRGGVALARPASAIRIREVVSAVGEDETLSGCVLGLKQCSDRTPCPVHAIWAGMKANLQTALLDRSLADFAEIEPPASRPAGPRRRPVRGRARKR